MNGINEIIHPAIKKNNNLTLLQTVAILFFTNLFVIFYYEFLKTTDAIKNENVSSLIPSNYVTVELDANVRVLELKNSIHTPVSIYDSDRFLIPRAYLINGSLREGLNQEMKKVAVAIPDIFLDQVIRSHQLSLLPERQNIQKVASRRNYEFIF